MSQECLAKGFTRAAAAIDKTCQPLGKSDARPDCPGSNQYPDGVYWANLIDIVVSNNHPYCE